MNLSDLEDTIDTIRKSIYYLDLDPIDLEQEDFSCEKNISYSTFTRLINLGKNIEFNEVIHQINSGNMHYSNKNKLNIFVINVNKIFNFCNVKNHEFVEVKMFINKMRDELEELNSKRDLEFLSTENFDLIIKSFYEGNPLVSDLFIELSSINLGDICRVRQEISIENKIFY